MGHDRLHPEQCWDCPSHGSQFAADGQELNGPANAPLESESVGSGTGSLQPTPGHGYYNMGSGLLGAPIGLHAVHLCIDMQNIFTPKGIWPAPWMPRVLPRILEICDHARDRTIFTRFITPMSPDDASGMWRRYYNRWKRATRKELAPQMLNLVPELAKFHPPAMVVDKCCYSAFFDTALLDMLRSKNIDTLVITGSETDVCVLATALDAVDIGFRVVIVEDAVCSSSDEGHDALLTVFHGRFSEQIETAATSEVISHWSL